MCGADALETQPASAAMIERIESNIIVETADRFASDLMVQVGYARLRERGINLITADSPNAF